MHRINYILRIPGRRTTCSGPPRVTLTNGGDLVGLLQHPFLPGVKGSDTVCRKMRGNLGCRLEVKPRIIWAALARRARGGYVHTSSQLQVERFKTEISEAFGVVSFDPETSRSLSRSKSSGVVSPVLVCI